MSDAEEIEAAAFWRWLVEEGAPDWCSYGPPPPDDENHVTITIRLGRQREPSSDRI